MENVIFWIVLAIIIISNISNVRKKMKKGTPPAGDSGKPEGWRRTLKDTLAQIRAEMEKASGESAKQPRRPSGWEHLLGGEQQAPEYEPSRPQPMEPGTRPLSPGDTQKAPRIETMETPRVDRGRESLMETLRKRGETPEARMDRGERERTASEHEREQRPERGIKRKSEDQILEGFVRPERMPVGAYSAAKLRNAMVWHEILSPPVALRDPGQNAWF